MKRKKNFFHKLAIAKIRQLLQVDHTALDRFLSHTLVQKGNPTHWADFNLVKIKPDTILFLNKDTVQRFDKKVGFDDKAISLRT